MHRPMPAFSNLATALCQALFFRPGVQEFGSTAIPNSSIEPVWTTVTERPAGLWLIRLCGNVSPGPQPPRHSAWWQQCHYHCPAWPQAGKGAKRHCWQSADVPPLFSCHQGLLSPQPAPSSNLQGLRGGRDKSHGVCVTLLGVARDEGWPLGGGSPGVQVARWWLWVLLGLGCCLRRVSLLNESVERHPAESVAMHTWSAVKKMKT